MASPPETSLANQSLCRALRHDLDLAKSVLRQALFSPELPKIIAEAARLAAPAVLFVLTDPDNPLTQAMVQVQPTMWEKRPPAEVNKERQRLAEIEEELHRRKVEQLPRTLPGEREALTSALRSGIQAFFEKMGRKKTPDERASLRYWCMKWSGTADLPNFPPLHRKLSVLLRLLIANEPVMNAVAKIWKVPADHVVGILSYQESEPSFESSRWMVDAHVLADYLDYFANFVTVPTAIFDDILSTVTFAGRTAELPDEPYRLLKLLADEGKTVTGKRLADEDFSRPPATVHEIGKKLRPFGIEAIIKSKRPKGYVLQGFRTFAIPLPIAAAPTSDSIVLPAERRSDPAKRG